MFEAHEGMSWEQWRRAVRLAESLGFGSVWRSDHLTALHSSRREVLETWTSLTVAALDTANVLLGPLVCSVTFRHPIHVARMAAALDRLSGGRFVCGLGTGSNAAEHGAFGLPFPPARERVEMLVEYVRVLRMLWTGEPVSFVGRHYSFSDALCLPRPVQDQLPIVIGGMGERFTLPAVAQCADGWNSYGMSLGEYRHKVEVLRRQCRDLGRDFHGITRSWNAQFVIGRDQGELDDRFGRMRDLLPELRSGEPRALISRLRRVGWLIGTVDEVADQMEQRLEAGVQRFILLHHDYEDDDALRLMAEVAPAAR